MGRVSDDLIEQWKEFEATLDYQDSWQAVRGRFVCGACVEDRHLSAFIGKNATRRRCSYCGRHARKPIAAPVDDVFDFIADAIGFAHWTQYVPYDEMPEFYETAADYSYGMQIDFDAWADDWMVGGDGLVDEVPLPLKSPLSGDFADAFEDTAWLRPGYDGYENEYERQTRLLTEGWRNLSEATRANRKFRPLDIPSRRPARGLSRRKILSGWLRELGLDGDKSDEIAVWLLSLDKCVKSTNIVKPLPSGAVLYRARVHDKAEDCSSARMLGTPPVSAARYANRMTPAGRPAFYAALDPVTAVREVRFRPERKKVVTVGGFRTTRDAVILDLEDLPPMPSIFDVRRRESIGFIDFLQRFADDISKPIEKGGDKQMEYRPTQILTEALRSLLAPGAAHKLDGIRYRSSLKDDGACIVLFVGNRQCTDRAATTGRGTRLNLVLDRGSVKRRSRPA